MITLDTFLEPVKKVFSVAIHQISTIPLDDPMIRRAKEIVPEQYHNQMWVAGSAATRYPQNGDVDIWVAEIPRGTDPWTIIPTNPKRMPTPDPDSDEYQMALKVHAELGLHIMAFHQTMKEVLDGFDISCHSAAVHLNSGEVLFGVGYSETAQIVNWIPNRPELTLERYLRFAKRYRDWSGLQDQKVQDCAASCWRLMTSVDMERKLKYLYIDRGL